MIQMHTNRPSGVSMISERQSVITHGNIAGEGEIRGLAGPLVPDPLRIQQITNGALTVEQGALYPALARLCRQGLLNSEWGISDNNHKAKYYRLTAAGRKRLCEHSNSWNLLAKAIAAALTTRPGEV